MIEEAYIKEIEEGQILLALIGEVNDINVVRKYCELLDQILNHYGEIYGDTPMYSSYSDTDLDKPVNEADEPTARSSSVETVVEFEVEVCVDDESEDEDKVFDEVNHPSHYTSGKIEVIDFIEDKGLCFHLANVIKYVSRAGKKCDEGKTLTEKTIEDLEKAEYYLHRKIELMKNGNKKTQQL